MDNATRYQALDAAIDALRRIDCTSAALTDDAAGAVADTIVALYVERARVSDLIDDEERARYDEPDYDPEPQPVETPW